ncbi:MAG: ClC family H(+)/Cl(-) exchange transporter [Burkholderiaceae bacterium]
MAPSIDPGDAVLANDIRSLEANELAEIENGRRGLLLYALIAILAGALIGLVGSAFRMVLVIAGEWRGEMAAWSQDLGAWGFLLPVLTVAICAAAARGLVRLAPLAAGSGVQHVEAVMRGEADPAPLRVLPVKFVGGALALGSGLALGREGPTVQMGATIGDTLAKWARMSIVDVRRMQTAVAGAGLGVAFSAPLGGAIFAFEEVARAFSVRLAVATLLASATATAVAWSLIGDAPDFVVDALALPAWSALLPFLLFGLLLGAAGVAYNRLVVYCLDLGDRLRAVPPELRAAVIGGLVGLLLWVEPALVGGGDELNQWILDDRAPWLSIAIIVVVRWFLAPLSYAAGTPGGLFAPLLLVGTAFGALFAAAGNALLPDLALDPMAFAIVGMAAFFAAVVRAPLTGIVLIVEMTATTSQIVPMLGATTLAVVAATVLRGPPVYDTLRLRMLKARALVETRTPI